MKSNGWVPLLNILIYYTKIFNKSTIYVNEFILTPFNSFDINCKKRNAKNLWKCIFRASSRVSFLYFHKVAKVLPKTLEFLWIMLKYSNQALRNL